MEEKEHEQKENEEIVKEHGEPQTSENLEEEQPGILEQDEGKELTDETADDADNVEKQSVVEADETSAASAADQPHTSPSPSSDPAKEVNIRTFTQFYMPLRTCFASPLDM